MSIGIIGYGHFGRFIHEVVSRHFPECEVKIASSVYAGAVSREEVCQCDIVFPCVPIKHFASSLSRIEPLLAERSILVEVCTVKSMPLSVLQSYSQLRYVCTHPMFGPESYRKQGNSLQDLRCVVCDYSIGEDERNALHELLTGLGLRLIRMSADEHDYTLASTLFLTHYIAQIVYGGAFDRTEIDTVTFGYLMDAVESVSADKELFLDVRTYNPYCQQIVERFHTTQEQIDTILSNKTLHSGKNTKNILSIG